MRRSAHHELTDWLDRHGYHHAHARKREGRTAHPYAHAAIVHQEPTGRPVFAAHERHHHITTSGRRALGRDQFALPPGPEEHRRGIAGRLPIDTLKRARNALTRAAQMKRHEHITASELAAAKHAVHRAWPSIAIS